MTLIELKQNSMLMVEGSRFDKRAIARITSQRGKFVPTKMIALLVAIEDYAELRRLRDFKGFKNLNKLRYDRAKLKQGLKCLGFKDEDIRVLDDPSMKVFTDTMNTIRSDCTKHYKETNGDGKSFVLIQYGGHGIQHNYTFALCNTIERKKIAFPLEQKTRDLGN